MATGKARSSNRRFDRHKERDETIELGRKIYDEIVGRLPAPLAAEALVRAIAKFHLEDSDAMMMAIAPAPGSVNTPPHTITHLQLIGRDQQW